MAGVTFLILLVTAGIRAIPSILIVPLEHEFGWTTAAISGAIAVNIALFGIIGPFAASFMARYGLRKIVLLALALLAFAVAFSSTMHHQWELMLFWGILVGTGTGVTALVLAAVVVNRWFEDRRGLVLGLLTAANATGQLVFLPLLAKLVTAHGWRSAVYFVAGTAGQVFLVVLFWMKDSPSDVGSLPTELVRKIPRRSQACHMRRYRDLSGPRNPASSGFWLDHSSFAAPAPTD